MNSQIIVVVLTICRMAGADGQTELQSEASEMLAEGLSSNFTKSSRIVGRKGAYIYPHRENDNILENGTARMEIFESTKETEVNLNTSKKELSPNKKVLGFDNSIVSQNDDQKHQLLLSTTPAILGTTNKYATNDIKGSGGLKRNYIIICICLVLIILAIALASVMYRKIKNWMELREYTRVVCRLKLCWRHLIDIYCLFFRTFWSRRYTPINVIAIIRTVP